MIFRRSLFCFLIVSMSFFHVKAQEPAPDTSAKKSNHPRNAALLSTVLPGAGQVYNKSYWKVPVVYAGFGAFGYMIYKNNQDFRYFNGIYRTWMDTETGNEIPTNLSPSQLNTYKEDARRKRDLFIFVSAFWYAANIIDAMVDAHFATFDVSDDLSLKITPYIQPLPGYNQGGLQLQLTYRKTQHENRNYRLW